MFRVCRDCGFAVLFGFVDWIWFYLLLWLVTCCYVYKLVSSAFCGRLVLMFVVYSLCCWVWLLGLMLSDSGLYCSWCLAMRPVGLWILLDLLFVWGIGLFGLFVVCWFCRLWWAAFVCLDLDLLICLVAFAEWFGLWLLWFDVVFVRFGYLMLLLLV